MVVRVLWLVLLVGNLLVSMNALAGTWYVDPNATGANSGTSWANAWTSFGAIAWGSINPGDTLFISGGSSTQTYITPLVIGKSGTQGSPITISVGQDAGHNGTAIFDGGGGTSAMINFGSHSWVTLTGNYNGARHVVVQNNSGTTNAPLIDGQGSAGSPLLGNKVLYTEIKTSGSGIEMLYPGGGAPAEVANNYVHDIRCEQAIRVNDGGIATAYDAAALVHDNIVQVNHQASNGNGPDAIQCNNGCSVYNNSISATVGTMSTACGQHQDGVQIFSYDKIYNNSIYCLANAAISGDWNGAAYTRIWNNTIAQCSEELNGGGVSINVNTGPVNDLLVYNNTFVDIPSTGYAAVGLNFVDSSATVSNSAIKNNIFYDVNWAVYANNGNYTCGSGLVIDSNNINTVLSGTPTVCDNVNYASTNLQPGAPVFISYTRYGVSNDYHLQASSSADIGHGSNLGSPYDFDKDGASRGTSWDLGAYQFTSSRPNPPVITSVVVR